MPCNLRRFPRHGASGWIQSRQMKYFYGEYDGEEFPTQDKLFGFDQLMQFILQYGDQALKAIEQMLKNPKDDAQSEMLQQLDALNL